VHVKEDSEGRRMVMAATRVPEKQRKRQERLDTGLDFPTGGTSAAAIPRVFPRLSLIAVCLALRRVAYLTTRTLEEGAILP